MKMNHLRRIFAGFTVVGACCSALAQQGPGWQFDREYLSPIAIRPDNSSSDSTDTHN